jgi:hypothetical protein
LARADDERWKRSLTAERDSMLQALEKLKPQLDRLAKDAEFLSASTTPDRIRGTAFPVPDPPIKPGPPPAEPQRAAPPSVEPARPAKRNVHRSQDECSKCGNPLGSQEVYCGSCGTLRSERPATSPEMDTTPGPIEKPGALDDDREHDDREPYLPLAARMARQPIELPPEVLALVQDEPSQEPRPDVADELLKLLPPEDWEGSPAVEAKEEPRSTGYPWTSAAHARTWLNSMADPKAGTGFLGLLRQHRGDISLVAAVLLVLVAVFWSRTERTAVPNSSATTSSSSTLPAAAPQTQETDAGPQIELSWWDRALIAVGLAEAPTAPPRPEPTGNPGINVWVDLRTALYYCPGTDLYGKTPKGRYTTQGEARNDRFEPASGRVCE